jgi:hypothetical protein
MTRVEHIRWCKERAIQEIAFSPTDPKQGIISMMSDLRKHPETDSASLIMLCMFELSRHCTPASVRRFIEGFN